MGDGRFWMPSPITSPRPPLPAVVTPPPPPLAMAAMCRLQCKQAYPLPRTSTTTCPTHAQAPVQSGVSPASHLHHHLPHARSDALLFGACALSP
eukprot:1160451-Pelagomonas_calceolata.AAC.22